ncbi:iron ABC transporter permease [Spiractinospora alimapuensis]|uniref:FecCD family ABC transporter permease n=1 Tax=Spiractinospora alimapuensis TaxID=2820884 RepID=UPI001F45ABD4|nr:iron ABC transporter permease [Spiractinospora alimapuensis]QVQ50144.1 iron ABC transporter permease [Spiractinospora alimapuensis]
MSTAAPVRRPPRDESVPAPRGRDGGALRVTVVAGLLCVTLLLGVTLALTVGSTPLTVGQVSSALFGLGGVDHQVVTIVWEVRVPRAVTALLAGAALGVAGAQMQTLLRNPLAEPYILGVSAGASLGVAAVVLGAGSAGGAFVSIGGAYGRAGLVVASALGAGAVLALVLVLARWTKSVVTLLIIGVMVGSGVTSFVSLLMSLSDPERMQRFVLWGLGNFSATTWPDLAWFAPIVAVGILAALTLMKPLNALLLGETYAQTMGVPVRLVRWLVILCASVLAGTVTAFCGPVAFLGLAIPHLTRIALGTTNHRVLLPGTALMGACVAVLCGTVAVLPGVGGVLPLNVVTSLIGAPIVIGVLIRSRAAQQGVGV